MSGHYDFAMAFDLRPDTPQFVMDVLRFMVGETTAQPNELPEADLFRDEDWRTLFQIDDYYASLPGEYGSRLREAYRYGLAGNEVFRNTLSFRCYLLDDTFYTAWWQFAEWVAPHSETTGCVGYFKEEFAEHPTLIYFKQGKVFMNQITSTPLSIRDGSPL